MTVREWLERHPEVRRERVEIQANYGDSFWTMTEDDYDEDIIYVESYDDGSALIAI